MSTKADSRRSMTKYWRDLEHARKFYAKHGVDPIKFGNMVATFEVIEGTPQLWGREKAVLDKDGRYWIKG